MPTDVLVAADTDRPDGPFLLDRAAPAGPEARTGRPGPALAADRAARGKPLARPGSPADRADRRRALVAAVEQVGASGGRPFGDLAEAPAAPARTLRLLVTRCADRTRIDGSGDGARLTAGPAGAHRARRAGLAAGTATRHACGGPTLTAASAAVLTHLLVLGVTGRADPSLVAPGVDALDLAAPGACPGTAARRTGCAYPARRGLAPQIGGDLAGPGAGRNGNRPVPGLYQRVLDPDQSQRELSRGSGKRAGMLAEERIQLAQRAALASPGHSENIVGGFGVQARQHGGQVGNDPLTRRAGPLCRGHDESGRRIVLRRTGGGAIRLDALAALRTCWLTTSTSIRSFGLTC